MPFSPRKLSDVGSGSTDRTDNEDPGFIHLFNAYLLNECLPWAEQLPLGDLTRAMTDKIREFIGTQVF